MSAAGFDVDEMASDLENGRLELVAFVEKLGPSITSTAPDDRAQAVETFTKVLAKLPRDYLSLAQLEFISTFYSDKLKDNHHVIPSVLDGIIILLEMKYINGDLAIKMLKSVFTHVPCQQQTRTDRHKIYNIIKNTAAFHIEDIKSMGVDFALSLIFSIDGERDPRNLMFIFSMLQTILPEINLGHVVEEMFEVIACYFPVDFNPPQNITITRNDLAKELSWCLCSIPSFGEYCIPLLLEKLNSELKVAKIDSLKLMENCCCIFALKDFETHRQEIWMVLHKIICVDSDPEIKTYAYNMLPKLIAKFTVSVEIDNKEKPLLENLFLKQVMFSMENILVNATTKSDYEIPLKIFTCISKSSQLGCQFIIENINSQLIKQINPAMEASLKILFMEYFSDIYEIRKYDTSDLVLLFLSIFHNNNTVLKLCAYRCLSKMPELLDIDKIEDIVSNDMKNGSPEKICEACKQCLLSLIKHNPSRYDDFVNKLICVSFIHYQNSTSEFHGACNLLSMIGSVEYFSDRIFKTFVDILQNTDAEFIIVDSFLKYFSSNKVLYHEKHIEDLDTKFNILSLIVKYVLKNNLVLEHLNYIIDIIVLIMRSKSSLPNSVLFEVNDHIKVNYENQTSAIKNYPNLIILYEALLNNMKPDDSFYVNILEKEDFSWNICCIAISNSNETIRDKACSCIANIFNKYINVEKCREKYDLIKANLLSLDTDSYENYSNAIILMSWLAKSFLHNKFVDGSFWLSKVLNIIKNEKWGAIAAKGIKLIMTEDVNSLSKDCFCQINFLYKQRVLQMYITFIEENGVHHNAACLESFVNIIEKVPRSLLLIELPKISPLILECLNSRDYQILLPTLDILSFLIINKKNICNLQTLLPKCLILSERNNHIKVRIATLQCIFEIADNYTTVQLLPHKQDVVLELANCLDDKKRVVRLNAIKARTRWFLIGSPGEDK